MANEYNISDKLAEVILSMVRHSMRVTDVAWDLRLHRNTVLYRIGRIKEITGKDPTNFYDLHELVLLVKAERGMQDGK